MPFYIAPAIHLQDHAEPILVNGGLTLMMSATFMAAVERVRRECGSAVLKMLAQKYPAQFFAGMGAMRKVANWDTTADGTGFSRSMTPEQIMDTLEERVGRKGRRLFEDFLRKVNKLQA
jgi:hypothetical protein